MVSIELLASSVTSEVSTFTRILDIRPKVFTRIKKFTCSNILFISIKQFASYLTSQRISKLNGMKMATSCIALFLNKAMVTTSFISNVTQLHGKL